MNARELVVLGGSHLADRIRSGLVRRQGVIVKSQLDVSSTATLVIDTRPLPSVEGDRPSSLLRVDSWLGFGLVGPLHLPRTKGCEHCAERRRVTACGWPVHTERALDLLRAQRERHDGLSRLPPSPAQWMVEYILDQVERVLCGEPCELLRSVHTVELSTLRTRLRRFTPDPLCPQCGHLPDDAEEATRITLQARRKHNAGGSRERPLREVAAPYRDILLDAHMGVITRITSTFTSTFADTWARLPLRQGGEERGIGRTGCSADSRDVAVLEALERYAGMRPLGKRTVVRGSLRGIGERAVDPRVFGLHVPEAYRMSSVPLEPFSEDQELGWVWAHSFLHERPVLVLEQLAYYGTRLDGSRDPLIVVEISNGCALGGSLEEAIFHGLLEVIERDGFLLTWYQKLPVPEIDLTSIKDEDLRAMIARIELCHGVSVRVFDITMEHGIPALWTVACEGSNESLVTYSAAGAHLVPEQAIRSALHELATIIPALRRRYREQETEARALADDPSKVARMDDHALLFCVPGVSRALGFVLDHHQRRLPLEEAFARAPRAGLDITADLQSMMSRFLDRGSDILVVDQTPADFLGDLRCVKVLVPGMLPMTFNHRLRRCVNLSRLYTAPLELGYSAAKDLNEMPHPFP